MVVGHCINLHLTLKVVIVVVVECGNPAPEQRPWKPRGQVVEAGYHQMALVRALEPVPINEMRST